MQANTHPASTARGTSRPLKRQRTSFPSPPRPSTDIPAQPCSLNSDFSAAIDQLMKSQQELHQMLLKMDQVQQAKPTEHSCSLHPDMAVAINQHKKSQVELHEAVHRLEKGQYALAQGIDSLNNNMRYIARMMAKIYTWHERQGHFPPQ
jgi:hypothetical protein